MRKHAWVAVVVAWLLGSAPAYAALSYADRVRETVLPNGLKVVWFLRDELPIVDLIVLVQSGFRDDPAGKSGTAEFVADLLDRGASGMTAKELAHSVEMLGASRYASAEDDTRELLATIGWRWSFPTKRREIVRCISSPMAGCIPPTRVSIWR